jgi:hypothetical protein
MIRARVGDRSIEDRAMCVCCSRPREVEARTRLQHACVSTADPGEVRAKRVYKKRCQRGQEITDVYLKELECIFRNRG